MYLRRKLVSYILFIRINYLYRTIWSKFIRKKKNHNNTKTYVFENRLNIRLLVKYDVALYRNRLSNKTRPARLQLQTFKTNMFSTKTVCDYEAYDFLSTHLTIDMLLKSINVRPLTIKTFLYQVSNGL